MRAIDLLVSTEEYLHTSYHPDRDYVDGLVLERNLGEIPHSWIQGVLIVFFSEVSKRGALYAFPELRVQVKPTRFRVPDVAVVRGPRPQGFILNTPPYLVIEILSREDRITGMQEKIDDYLTFGIPYIWIINPVLQKGFVVTSAGMVEAKNGFLETDDPAIRIPLPLVFS
jgi:Uma2 family endonuclease